MLNFIKTFAVPSILAAIISYLLGSISFSIIFTRIFNKEDIRTLGSGNAGLTNVLRSAGVKAGVFTLIFDFAKGAAAVCVGKAIFQYFCASPPYCAQYGAYLAGLFCVIGHIYPLYFQFKGGKGILSTAAVLVFVDWRLFVIAISVFTLVFVFSKIVSLASIVAASSFPLLNIIIVYFCDYRGKFPFYKTVSISYVWVTTVLTAAISFFILYRHRPNIRRLKSGTEKKFTIKHS